MCPACMASAAWIAGSVISAGGITALAAKILGWSGIVTKGDLNNKTEGRNDHGFSNQQGRAA